MMDLTRFLIVVLICSSVNTIHAQFIVKGTVQDPEGNGLPGVKISVANTTYGVISDYDGQYFLELNSSGKYPIRFHAQTFHFFLSRCSLIKPSIRIIILMGPICKPFICITSMVIF